MKESRNLFENIAWSTDKVLAQTLEQANGLDLTIALLPKGHDVDTLEDLKRLGPPYTDSL